MNGQLSEERENNEIPTLATVEASALQRRVALGVVLALAAATAVGIVFANVRVSYWPAVMPIFVTIWVGAGIITAFLLATEFLSTGLLVLAVLSALYVINALLSAAQLAAFPEAFSANGLGDVGPWLYAILHAIFPIAIAAYAVYDASLSAFVPLSARVTALRSWQLGALVFGGAIVAAIYRFSHRLPRLLGADHRFSAAYMHVGVPLTSAIVLFAVAMILMRTGARTSLQTWLLVALIASLLDFSCHTVAVGLTSATWYVAEFDAVVAATILLVALLLDIEPVYRIAIDLAATDPLTGLANRRTLMRFSDWLIRHARRQETQIAVLMVDVDKFKLYNDRYSHSAGDACLRSVAQCLASQVRSDDLVARYGGEEFCVVLSNPTREGAQISAERLRAAVEALAIEHADVPGRRVTISIGVRHAVAGGSDVKDLIEIADEALYKAKDGGRNRYVIAA